MRSPMTWDNHANNRTYTRSFKKMKTNYKKIIMSTLTRWTLNRIVWKASTAILTQTYYSRMTLTVYYVAKHVTRKKRRNGWGCITKEGSRRFVGKSNISELTRTTTTTSVGVEALREDTLQTTRKPTESIVIGSNPLR